MGLKKDMLARFLNKNHEHGNAELPKHGYPANFQQVLAPQGHNNSQKFNGNPMVPVSTDAPLGVFEQRDHPMPPPDRDGDNPVETNKFYTNMLLEERNLPAWTHPYSMWWSKIDNFWGLAVSHTTKEQRVFGPDPNSNPAQFYFCPAGIISANFSAREFTGGNVRMRTSSMGPLSVTVALEGGNGGNLTAPLAMGMGFVTTTYNNLTPLIQSQVGFRGMNKLGAVGPNGAVHKYELLLNNNVRWLCYVSGQTMDFNLADMNNFVGSGLSNGTIIQIASAPQGTDAVYDQAAGAYALTADIEANVTDDGAKATYRIKYNLAGQSSSGNTMIFALPHQVSSFTENTKSKMHPNIQLDSTVMGPMTACLTSDLEMEETLPCDIGFLPWAQFSAKSDEEFLSQTKYDAQTMDLMKQVAAEELDQDMKGQTNLDSMYFSGKGFDKFAFILTVTHYILKDQELTKRGLEKLTTALSTFVSNKQINPLAYDRSWKGLVSVAGLGGDANADFGNSFYNDHHFHYGYFIRAAAVIGSIDRDLGGNWLNENKEWINNLVRDVSNPSPQDKYFPVFRSFDWFTGHSWAKGLFLSGDGKDEESSSEDYHFAYALKLWGKTIGDAAMEARGNLILAIMRRSMNLYMLYSDGNTVEPQQFVGNRVSGIMFENKVDHATYFGLNPEYIQGIHMIPLTPASSYVRNPDFVRQEWDSIISKIVNSVDDGWKGILKLNQALYDPNQSAQFFTSKDFKSQWLDPGMSRTWAIALAKGI
ncbi:hypothetical protein TRICI_001104 [Trichomonascus ciferrii]|uniref:glucan endo-1,3-beta-D-glucosidase n=1 Tax=Trichomonascus ciferrii TaxID=44093 RepID=A0A642VA82_9ASCO|nr:hypothetical protein TRICI_001104 [Trichomonascus ciferrii]